MKNDQRRKLEIDSSLKKQLPLFYNHILYNEGRVDDIDYELVYSQKLDSYTEIGGPSKLISRIIDFSQIQGDDEH